jgi:hypothetical protein
MALQHLRSSTANKRPTPGAMSDGQLALNTNLASPGLFFKDSNGDSVKIGPVHVGTTAPNVTPGAGGQAGNSKGEAWLDTSAANPILKVFNGSAFVAVQPVGTGTVVSTTDTGTVTSTMILDGTILNADINASAAIVDTKLATIATGGKVSGTAITSGNISTSGSFTSTSTVTGTNLIPTGSGVPTNGIYLPAANSVAVATNGTGRLFVDATGNVGVGAAAPDERLTLGAAGKLKLNRSDNATGATIHNGGNLEGLVFNELNSEGYKFQNNGTTALRINSLNQVGVGTTSPGSLLHLSAAGASYLQIQNTTAVNSVYFGNSSGNGIIQVDGANSLNISTNGSERCRVDSSGRLLIGTSSAFDTSYIGTNYQIGIEKLNTYAGFAMKANFNNADGCYILLAKSRGSSLNTKTVVNDGDNIGAIVFEGADGTNMLRAAQITCLIDGTPAANDMPGRLVFATTASGASSPTERMRITQAGNVLFGKTTTTNGVAGINLYAGTTATGVGEFTSSGDLQLVLNRLTDDGILVDFRQDGTSEGTISVSGTTVSYNGAHLSRWSQLPSGAEREEILRGSVLSNIDEMCEWTDEENEQLNRMKVSDVEGDKNVSGVFQAWDDDDDTYTDDFYCAMTGDFIIRIAEGVTVERGDLLMSAGDGTAKPQDDDLVRSCTVAKVTSTNVSCTYDDGSYCVPCVLMAC